MTTHTICTTNLTVPDRMPSRCCCYQDSYLPHDDVGLDYTRWVGL